MSFFAEQDSTPRRGFLGRLTAGTIALAGVAAIRPRVLEAEPVRDVHAGADEWLNGLNGTYRQFFDAVSVNEGFPFSFAMTFMNTIGEAYKVPDKDINAVVGLRHFAIPLAFNDDIWAKYKLGEMFKVNDPVTKAPAVRNPYAYAKEGELLFPGMAFEKIQARGAIFTVCNVALTVLSGMSAGFAGQPKETAKQDWLSGMFKGVNVVPSGVFAVNRAQKKGCTYCYAG
jgi:intracellular sulfur oxidation DsrE/DsrF family protein